MQRPALIGALLLVVAGVVLGATVFRTDIAQATGLAQAVTVNNTPANPVPVHEQGTAQVNVTNSSLDVSGTVGIDPGANGVHEVNSVAESPFARTAFTSFGSGNPDAFNAELDVYTVPSGKRAIVTYAAVSVNIPAGEHATVVILNGGSSRGFLPLTDAGSFNVSGPTEFLTGGGLVNIVYEAGEHIVLNAFRSQDDGDNIGQFVATVTGFVLPA